MMHTENQLQAAELRQDKRDKTLLMKWEWEWEK